MVRTKSDVWIAGLTGRNASGKGEAARILTQLGYQYRSLSDIVRTEVAKLGKAASRENLIETANGLRRKEGAGVLAARTVPLLSAGIHVIDSIRHPDEVTILRSAGHFLLIGIDAPIEVRFQRAQSRARDESAGTLEEFKAIEDRERTTKKNVQQLDATFDLADQVVMNDRDLSDLEKEIEIILRTRQFPIIQRSS